MLLGFLAFSIQTYKVRAESATLFGTVLYDEKPISQFTSIAAVFWLQNETSGNTFFANPTYNTSTGEYSIPNMPPGEYGISVFFDSASPFNGKEGFAGDFDGWNVPIDIPEDQSTVNQNLTVAKTLHLTSPVDNSATIAPWSSPRTTYSMTEVTFMWDSLAEASSYHIRIDDYQEPSTDIGPVLTNVTSNVSFNATLPMSLDNHFYDFWLYAYNLNGVIVGKLMVPYGSGYGWDFQFRLSPQPVAESCNLTGDLKSNFDLGETVYLTGANFSASKTFNLFIVIDQATWTNGMTIPDSLPGTLTNVSTDSSGDIPPTAIWTDSQATGNYDIVVDVDGNGQYNVGIDALYVNATELTAGFSVVPEFLPSLILPLLITITLLAIGIKKMTERRKLKTEAHGGQINKDL